MNKIANEIKQQIQERIKTLNESVHNKILQECRSNVNVHSTFKAPSLSKQRK